MKIRPVGAELFNADRQTDGPSDEQKDMPKLIVTFRNFVPPPTKILLNIYLDLLSPSPYVNTHFYLVVNCACVQAPSPEV